MLFQPLTVPLHYRFVECDAQTGDPGIGFDVELITGVAQSKGWRVTWGKDDALHPSHQDFNTTVSFVCQPPENRVLSTLSDMANASSSLWYMASWRSACMHACMHMRMY